MVQSKALIKGKKEFIQCCTLNGNASTRLPLLDTWQTESKTEVNVIFSVCGFFLEVNEQLPAAWFTGCITSHCNCSYLLVEVIRLSKPF